VTSDPIAMPGLTGGVDQTGATTVPARDPQKEQVRKLAQEFEAAEQRFVAAPGQALVEKNVGSREDGRTIDVVLHLAVGEVADAHRPHAAIACQ